MSSDATRISAPPSALLRHWIVALMWCWSAMVGAPVAAQESADEAPEFPAFEEKAIDGAFLTIDRGVAIVHVYGDPAERGRRLGELLKPQIHYMVHDYVRSFFTEEGLANAYPVALGLETAIPRYLYREMKGLAEGAGIEYRDLLLANCWVDAFARFGCSAIVAEGTRSSTGKLLLARNLDWPLFRLPEESDFILVVHPDKGPATLTITWPGMIGAISGMNAEGFTLAMLVSFHGAPRLVGMPNVLAYRALLDSATSLDDVTPFFEENKIIAPNSLVLADATGKGRVLELDPYFQGYSGRDAEDGILVCTNLFQIGTQNAPMDWRYKSLEEAGEAKRRHTQFDLRTYLGRVAPNQGRVLANVQSMILEPETRTLLLSAQEVPAAGGKFLRFDAAKLFAEEARPSTPVAIPDAKLDQELPEPAAPEEAPAPAGD